MEIDHSKLEPNGYYWAQIYGRKDFTIVKYIEHDDEVDDLGTFEFMSSDEVLFPEDIDSIDYRGIHITDKYKISELENDIESMYESAAGADL